MVFTEVNFSFAVHCNALLSQHGALQLKSLPARQGNVPLLIDDAMPREFLDLPEHVQYSHDLASALRVAGQSGYLPIRGDLAARDLPDNSDDALCEKGTLRHDTASMGARKRSVKNGANSQ